MRKWNFVALVLALGVILAPMAVAQSNDLDQEVQQLRRDLNRVLDVQATLSNENAALRNQLNQTAAASSALEQHINDLADGMDYAANVTAENAQKVAVDGEFRIRSAYVSDFDAYESNGDISDDDGTYVDYRMRVGLNFNFDADVSARFVMQASGLYGEDTSYQGYYGSNGDLSMYEGWMQFDNVFGREELSVRAGRQELVLGNEFQFGNNDYHAGKTWDGSHWQWAAESFNLSLIWATVATDASHTPITHPVWGTALGGNYASYDDTELWAAYFTLNSIENVTLDLYWIYVNNDLDSFVPHMYYHTVGARIAGSFDVAAGLDYNLEAAGQFGDIGGFDTEVGGWTVEAELGITFDADSNFRLYSRLLWAEGYDADDDETGYLPSLGAEQHSNTGYRARYGYMEIIPMWDVLTWQIGATFDPAADWTIGATFLWASRDSEDDWGDDDDMGWELDLFAENRYSAQTTVGGGIAFFFQDEDYWGNDDTAVMLYMQARIVF